MVITLSPTGQIDTFEGTPSRVWIGTDDTGAPVKAWITSVSPQTDDEAVHARFAKALKELPRPLVSMTFDARLLS